MQFIIGLGNPGDKYQYTRHNTGFLAVDFLARKLNLHWENKKKFYALCAFDPAIILCKPQTFMNNSGEAVFKLLDFYNYIPRPLEQNQDFSACLTIVHDDIDVNLGKYKITNESRSAGHNGVQSIFDHLKTKKIKRIRIGVRNLDRSLLDASDFVLQKFSHDEILILNRVIEEVINKEI